jgi:glycosyltransferase involved in cell wall biosynthesis
VKVLVTHPGRQHSHQAAVALAKVGALAGYWSGVPSTADQFARMPRLLRRALGRYRPVELPPSLARWLPWTPGRRRLGDRLLPRFAAAWNDFGACRAFDRRVARNLGATPLDAVLACEISADRTFAEARRRGLRTLLDAPSFHHRTQDRLTGVHESRRLHARIARVKDAEIALADHVITVSPLARESYVEAGVPATRVHSLELGADLHTFRPPDAPPAGADCAFLFCGAQLHRKGFDLVVEAFRRLGTSARARLSVVGPPADASRSLEAGSRDYIDVVGALPQERVAALMAASDCLVLPSRHDSYGMVVAEAMACGLPAIVSETVGAKSLVREGVTGFVVPTDDAAALGERMSWCVDHLAELRRFRDDCRRAAEGATWDAYHARFAALVRQLVEA